MPVMARRTHQKLFCDVAGRRLLRPGAVDHAMVNARNHFAFLIDQCRADHDKFHRAGTAGFLVNLFHFERHADWEFCAGTGRWD